MSCHPPLLHKLNIKTNVPWVLSFALEIQILIFMVNTQICTCDVKDATNIWKTWSNTICKENLWVTCCQLNNEKSQYWWCDHQEGTNINWVEYCLFAVKCRGIGMSALTAVLLWKWSCSSSSKWAIQWGQRSERLNKEKVDMLPLRFSSPTVDGGWCWPFQYGHNAVIVFTCCVIISMLAVCGPATIWQDYKFLRGKQSELTSFLISRLRRMWIKYRQFAHLVKTQISLILIFDSQLNHNVFCIWALLLDKCV